jgi:hypothetical protein
LVFFSSGLILLFKANVMVTRSVGAVGTLTCLNL